MYGQEERENAIPSPSVSAHAVIGTILISSVKNDLLMAKIFFHGNNLSSKKVNNSKNVFSYFYVFFFFLVSFNFIHGKDI